MEPKIKYEQPNQGDIDPNDYFENPETYDDSDIEFLDIPPAQHEVQHIESEDYDPDLEYLDIPPVQHNIQYAGIEAKPEDDDPDLQYLDVPPIERKPAPAPQAETKQTNPNKLIRRRLLARLGAIAMAAALFAAPFSKAKAEAPKSTPTETTEEAGGHVIAPEADEVIQFVDQEENRILGSAPEQDASIHFIDQKETIEQPIIRIVDQTDNIITATPEAETTTAPTVEITPVATTAPAVEITYEDSEAAEEEAPESTEAVQEEIKQETKQEVKAAEDTNAQAEQPQVTIQAEPAATEEQPAAVVQGTTDGLNEAGVVNTAADAAAIAAAEQAAAVDANLAAVTAAAEANQAAINQATADQTVETPAVATETAVTAPIANGLDVAMRTAFAEGAYDSEDAARSIADTIINRAVNSGTSVGDVVAAKGQFSAYINGVKGKGNWGWNNYGNGPQSGSIGTERVQQIFMEELNKATSGQPLAHNYTGFHASGDGRTNVYH